MPTPPESPRRKEMRVALRALINQVIPVKQPSIPPGMIPAIHFSPMDLDLDVESSSGPIFFAPYPATLFPDPDDNYDRAMETKYTDFDSISLDFRDPMTSARAIDHYLLSYASYCSMTKYCKPEDDSWSTVSLEEVPFVGLYQYNYPEYGSTGVLQVRDGSSTHLKAFI
ncbi:hypothetical protein BO70DRAFT_380681 [Aspergillus heteromorphus CBS 117.55]|uniref:Uncharacterized protein n=1 Tax=Aspergillus heteromorphus CBS 117.55 TaxID=1448321 RepID=A0A317VSW9_9EURO|nr:uncharacterized protein BO70DRAFT_380681 [Aspergillus heteromorphus CBS 117.55]PWY77423.1 hypothetical protein BO70DRAFT_380681 [Aspergillus heteromorphus CBS 117.55]